MATLNKIVQLFFEVVTETSALVVLEILLLDSLSTNDMVENYIGSLSESFPIPLSCHLLNLILNAAFKVPGQLQRWRILQLSWLINFLPSRNIRSLVCFLQWTILKVKNI
ncbi:hypothetical protein Bca52824_048713 [Brassica carinata]|uniref:Uncharacterized protein n=1 Tax=Brassica carinata TaxID=52824 RepID=A0A8X7USG1_BRACI|nr:hypothetical protein Bca52824_048713 [Brassica carinata]